MAMDTATTLETTFSTNEAFVHPRLRRLQIGPTSLNEFLSRLTLPSLTISLLRESAEAPRLSLPVPLGISCFIKNRYFDEEFDYVP